MNDMDLAQEIIYDNGENSSKNFEDIAYTELREFIICSLNKYGTKEKYKEANKVADMLTKMLIAKKQITETNRQNYIDILISAALLHNLFYVPGTITTLFEAREKLQPLAEEVNLPENIANALFQTIEAQLGEDTPVPTSKPIPNSPTELFAWAVWFVKESSN